LFSGNLQLDIGELNVPKTLIFNANSTTGGSYGDIKWYNVQWDGNTRGEIVVEGDGSLANGRMVFKTGSSGSNATERMRITSGGRLLLGTTTDNGARLQVSGNQTISGTLGVGGTSLGDVIHVIRNGTTSYAATRTTNSSSTADMYVGVGGSDVANTPLRNNAYVMNTAASSLCFGTSNAVRLTIASTGAATFSSSVTATSFFESSDSRLKNIIKRDGDVAYFKWKNGQDNKTHIGYIAQEVQKANPDQVKADDKGMLSVNYIEILVQKVRDLEKEIAELKKHIK
jgi:hypothetical protein